MDRIELDNLTRTYFDAQGETFCALDHASLIWEQGHSIAIMGESGSGKSTWLFKKIQKDASGNPGINYLVLVPDQFTLETQKTLVSLNGNKGILNIDVLSFHRLAYRAFEEVPALRRTVLEDMGKIMILYQVFSKKKKEMLYFKRGLNAAGFLDECKSPYFH